MAYVTCLVAACLGAAACAGTNGINVSQSNRHSPTTTTGNGGSTSVSATSDSATSESASGAGGDSETTSTTTRGPTGNGTPITLAFGGDASFEDLVGQLKSNPTSLLSAIAPTMSGADFAMVNLETSLGTTGTKVPKAFNFQVPPQAIDALKAAGVDAVSMANNHGMDYGAVGLQDSLAIKASSGFPILGVGQNDTEAYAPLVTEIKGQRVGVIAASDVFDAALVSSWTATPDHPGIASVEGDHLQRLVQEVQTTRPKVDTLVVYLHFGTEKQTCPNARQKEVVDALLAAGVDIVIGSHPHRLQGVGYQGKQLVAYSMSNFIFRGPSSESRKTGVLMVTATGQQIDGFEWKPATLQGNVPVLLSGAASQAALTEMAQRRACAGLTETPT